jgi:hypothetical protein
MLDKAASEKNYFLEEYTGEAIVMVAAYGKEKPDIRDLAKKVSDYLDRGQTKERSKRSGTTEWRHLHGPPYHRCDCA